MAGPQRTRFRFYGDGDLAEAEEQCQNLGVDYRVTGTVLTLLERNGELEQLFLDMGASRED